MVLGYTFLDGKESLVNVRVRVVTLLVLHAIHDPTKNYSYNFIAVNIHAFAKHNFPVGLYLILVLGLKSFMVVH